MSANANASDSEDLDDLDYGEDEFDTESKIDFSQNSGLRSINREAEDNDVDDEEGQDDEDEEEEEEEEDDEEIETADKDNEGQDESCEEHHDQLGYEYHNSSNRNRDNQRKGQKRKHQDDEDDCDQSRNSDKRNVERCKYWPYCTAGVECAFYHPTKPCRSFPNCRFGSNCLYIHPPCKFMPNCAKPDCPFAHPAKNTPAMRGRGVPFATPVPMASQFRPQAMQQPAVPKCKFGFKCANLMCKFSHQASEPCRYGANCLLDNCAFTHPTDSQAQQEKKANVFKWSAKS